LSNLVNSITRWLKPFEILRLARVSKGFNILFYHQKIWKSVCPKEIVLHNSANRNFRIVYKEYLMTTKLVMMPLLSFRSGGQELFLSNCDHFTEFEFSLQIKNMSTNSISLIKILRKLICPDEYAGLQYEWKLCLTQISKSISREFSCVLSTFKNRDDQFFFQTFPFNPSTSLKHLKPGQVSKLSFQIPLQWLLLEAKELSTQNPLYYYFRRKKKHKFRIFLIYYCKNDAKLLSNVTSGTFQTTSTYLTAYRSDMM